MKTMERIAIQLSGDGIVMARPAGIVWVGSRGIAWVEPAYLDPMPGRPAFHVLAGTVEEVPGGVLCFGRDYTANASEPPRGDVLEALEWADGELKARGSTWEREREELEALVADGLATIA